MKKIVKFSICILLLIIAYLLSYKVYGASSYVSVSNTSVNIGDTFTVTIAGNVASWNIKLNYSGPVSLVSGSVSDANVTSSGNNENVTFITATFKATGEGKATFKASGQLVNSDFSSTDAQGSKTVSITKASSGGNQDGNSGGNQGGSTGGNQGNSSGGASSGSSNKKPTTTTKPPEEVKKSTDNTLSELSIEGGQISPEFNKDVKEYSLTVPYEVIELNVTATPNDSKAKVEIIGNKDLQEGENVLTIRVTAEDGSVLDYVVKVTRARIPLALKSLVIKYQNENGELLETALNPAFSFDVFEYSLEEMEYWVEKLSVEAIPNIEGANIDVQGADNLQAGENTVTITAKIPKEAAEGEEPKEEIITYTIKFNKKQEPTTMEKLSDWYNQNEEYVIISALGVCVVFLFGLSIYIIVDHNKYKHIIARVKEENNFKSNNIFEEVSEETLEEKDNTKSGKRFK